ncbi:MAG: GntR family transcriptional regulator [Casimicrobiaceae bacterium]
MKTATGASPRALAALKRALKANGDPAVPRYARLRDALVVTIEAGHWKVGDRLPPETELCQAVPFSLGTVQRALRALVDEGLVKRVQGSGTYVAALRGKVDDVAFCRFLADDGKSLLPVSSRVLARGPAKGHGPWTAHFSGPGVKIVRVDRILDVNGEFNVFSSFYFDATRCRGLASRPLSDLTNANLKELLRDELDMPGMGLEQSFLIARIPRAIGAHIGVPDTIGGILEGIGRASGNDVVYFQQMFIPPSHRKWVPYAEMTPA